MHYEFLSFSKFLAIQSATESSIRCDSEFRARAGSNSSNKSRRTSLNNNNRSASIVALEATLTEVAGLVANGISHKTSACIEQCRTRQLEPHHALYGAVFESLDEIFALNKDAMCNTLKKVKAASELAARARAKTSAWTRWLAQPDYDVYTDGASCPLEIDYQPNCIYSRCRRNSCRTRVRRQLHLGCNHNHIMRPNNYGIY